MQRVLFIYNRHAGKNKTWASLSDIINAMTEQDCLVTTYPTQYRGDAGEAIVRWSGDFDRVVVAGGDGTLSEAVAGAARLPQPPLLGYIPVGTTNDFAKNLNLPLDSLTDLAVTAVTAALPQRERQGAEAICAQLGVRRLVYPLDVLALPAFQTNPPDRCYHCKKALLAGMLTLAQEAGFPTLVDGSNVDDTGDYRPGMRALAELGIQSPLLAAGLTKGDIRALSHRFHLPTWNQPSAACLASRIPYGEAITEEKLALVEQAEQFLAGLGLTGLRVRLHGGTLARIEVPPEQLDVVLTHRMEIVRALTGLGCTYVTVDLVGYRMGSLNETLEKG